MRKAQNHHQTIGFADSEGLVFGNGVDDSVNVIVADTHNAVLVNLHANQILEAGRTHFKNVQDTVIQTDQCSLTRAAVLQSYSL